MTRIVVGPFNRVEGDLEVTLEVKDGVVAEAWAGSPLYRGFEHYKTNSCGITCCSFLCV